MSPVVGLVSGTFTIVNLLINWSSEDDATKIINAIKDYMSTAFNSYTIRDETSKIAALMGNLGQFTEHIEKLTSEKDIVDYIEGSVLGPLNTTVGPDGNARNACYRLKTEWHETPWKRCDLLSPTLKALCTAVNSVLCTYRYLVMVNAQRVAYYTKINDSTNKSKAQSDYNNALIDYHLWCFSENTVSAKFCKGKIDMYANFRKKGNKVGRMGDRLNDAVWISPGGESIVCSFNTYVFWCESWCYDENWNHHEFYHLSYADAGGWDWWVVPAIKSYCNGTLMDDVNSIVSLKAVLDDAQNGCNKISEYSEISTFYQ